ncbi:MAG TPA: hypothetical protein VKB36_23805 [Vicinamibacterales bacterium]|nr:hypothetical protein [Vicinamibacterales bacterium]
MADRFRLAFLLILALLVASSSARSVTAEAGAQPATALGIDVNFYTGPIRADEWQRLRQAGQSFAIAQAWGGRSRNEFAESQLAGARTAGLRTGAYVLLNYDDKVCPTFDKPVRDFGGGCFGDPIAQVEPGGRWQVRQGVAALGRELASVAFVAIDVEWFLAADPPSDREALQRRRQTILDAIDEVVAWRKRPVVYTRNGPRHWFEITGCSNALPSPDCGPLYAVVRHPLRPVPLWDVEIGPAELDGFQPHGAWTSRIGRQYGIGENPFGLPPDRTYDLNVFDLRIFSTPSH